MRFRIWATLLLLFAFASPVFAASRFILRTDPAVSAQDVATRHGLTFLAGDHGAALVAVPTDASIAATFEDVTADASVIDFEPDRTINVPEVAGHVLQSTAGLLDQLPVPSAISYFGTPVLGSYLSQPAVSLIRLQEAQSTFKVTGTGIVAIIDTGVDPGHTALQTVLVPGYDFVHEIAGTASEFSDIASETTAVLTQSTAGLLDKTSIAFPNQSTAALLDQSTAGLLDTTSLPAAFGHGTMVAGVVHLTAPTAQIMPLKAFAGDGSAHLFDILRAVYYAVDHGAGVINMSFSLTAPSQELERAVGYANNHGVICVASAGNTGTFGIGHPAALPKVVGVASSSNLDLRSKFSSYGTPVSLAAPGEAIITTYPGQNYAAAWGTSFSAPFVSGGTSLLLELNPLMELSRARKAFAHSKTIAPDLGRMDIYEAMLFGGKN